MYGESRLLVATVALVAALWPALGASQQLAVVSYTSDDGPAHPQVWGVLHDSRGYLWVGTSEGLSRWDGVEFQDFTAADGLPDLTIRNLLEDREGRLWLGTDAGVAVYDGRRFETFPEPAGPASGTVWCSAEDRHGRRWFGTHLGGVMVWTGSGFRAFTEEHGLASNYVYSLLVDSRDRLWLGHRGHGLTRCRVSDPLDLVECRTFTTADGLAFDEVRAFAEDRWGRVWIGTRGGGLSRWDGTGFVTFAEQHGLASNDVYALLISDRDELVIGTVRHGITTCNLPDLDACRTFGMRNGFADDGVLTLALDHERTLWAGLSNGLSHLWTESVESYTLTDGLPHPTVYSVLADSDGTVWVGTLDGIARIRRPEAGTARPEVVSWKSEGVLPGYEVWEMCRDVSGRLWAATERGMCRFADGRCTTILTAADGLADTDLITVLLARDGSMWVGTVNGASQLVFPPGNDRPEITNLTVEDGLAGPSVNGVAEDAAGSIWLGTDRGLSRWDGQLLATFTVDHGLPVGEILAVRAIPDGGLWLGTNGGGLVGVDDREDGPNFETHGSANGVPEVVSALFDAGGGALWLGTGEGALRYDPRQRAVLERLDVGSGLLGSEVQTFARDASGALWIGTTGGLTRVDARREQRPPAPPRVVIERARTIAGIEWRSPFTAPTVNRDPQVAWLGQEPVELSHEFAALRFEFRALAFGPREIRYQTLLEGFDREWSRPFGVPFKEYTNLDPGEYALKVRAALLAGQWSEPAVLEFRVVPAWWQTTWLRLGSVLLVVAALVGGIRIRMARIHRRTHELERAVAERTDDLRRYARALEEHSGVLDRANIRIRHADRIKSQFLANMSHELRTPLNSIIGFSEVLVGRLGDRLSEREQRFLNNVSRSGRYLLRLINNLLDLSKIEADRMDLHIEEVELGPVIEETRQVVQGYAADRSVTIAVDIAPSLGPVEVDVAKLSQIVINLLSNAIKFSDQGGTVEVAVRPVDAEPSALGVASYELAVTDHGPGVEEESKEVIFEAFGQARGGTDHPGGTGLGLALVQEFVTLLGGTVSFESVPSQNTTFRALLPVHPTGPRTEPADQGAEAAEAEALSRPCVLVVERGRQRFADLARTLESHGLLPVRAGDPAEARRMIEGLRPAALILHWAPDSRGEWADLARLVAGPDGLPGVFAAHLDKEIGAVRLAADVSLLHPAEPQAVVSALRSSGVQPPGVVALAGPELSSAPTMIAALEAEGFEVGQDTGGDDGSAESLAAMVVDLSGPEPESVMRLAITAPPSVVRVVLLPSAIEAGTAPADEAPEPDWDELACEVRHLLDRRSRHTREQRFAADTR